MTNVELSSQIVTEDESEPEETEEDEEDIPEIPKYCPVLGIEIKSNTTNAPLDSSPSLDRIDSSKGYIKGNVRIISNRANRIKSDATIEELRKVLEDYEKISSKNK